MALLTHLAIISCVFILLGSSLNLALGYAGLINLGHVAFFGVGAYTSAILTLAGFPFLAALVASALLAGFVGFCITKVTGRLHGDYFALATLGIALVARNIFQNWDSVTRGPLGIPGIPRPEIFGFTFQSNSEYLVLTLFITVLCVYFIYRVVRSPYGRLLEALRDDALGLSALGKNIDRLKYQSMSMSAGIAGIAGSIYAHYITFIDPSTFFISDIVIMLTIVLVGGVASLRGSVVAAIIVIVLPELLRFLHFTPSTIGASRMIIYSLLLICILLFRPRGLFGRVDLS